MEKTISLDERKEIYLTMLKEVDAFCRSHHIRYSLSSGTLIGALRHKGFIPWDDDLDITMPLPDLLKFKQVFHSETIKYCDVDTCKHYMFSFPRLEYIPTYSKRGLFNIKGMGISIDVYPIVGLPVDSNQKTAYLEKAKRNYSITRKFIILSRTVSRIVPIPTIPGLNKIVRKTRNHLFNNSYPYQNAKEFLRIAGPMVDKIIKKNTLDFDFFDKIVDISFEGCLCNATGHADEYLTQKYGNYMQYPPVNQRKPNHSANFYWK